MRETNFIKQNKGKWQEFERILDAQQRDPDKLNELFVQITDDLSYSRTFYPNRSVRVYLNGLAQRVFFSIYRTRQSSVGRLFSFWTDELPRLVHESRRSFRLSFWLFVFAFMTGVISAAMDPEFSAIILGEDYVEMTIENIESGDPMAVYKQRGRLGMSLGITIKNIFIAFMTFVMGAFFVVGSIAFIIRNGIMVGVFQYFFIERNLFWESFLTIWIHGTLEISALIIAGAAGITMGKGLVFPGTYRRMQSFQQSARRGVKIMIGTVPIFIMAGFFEGYLTRHTDTPDIVRGLFILVCLIFVLVYFVWYPRMRARLGFEKKDRSTDMPPDSTQRIDFERIKSPGEVFADAFVFFKKQAGKIAAIGGLTALVYTAAALLLSTASPEETFSFPNFLLGTLSVLDQFFINARIPLLPVINFFVLAGLTTGINALLIRERHPERSFTLKQYLLSGFKVIAGVSLIQLLLYTYSFLTLFLWSLLASLPLLFNYILMEERSHIWPAIQRTRFLLRGNYGRVLSLFLTLSLLGLLFFSIIDTSILWTFLDLISWVVQFEEEVMNELSIVILTFVTIFSLYMIFSMLLAGIGVLYYSLCELQEAGALRERIRQIGKKQDIQGIEREGKNY
jgi:uncharacterized membrane protein SpoIIM required for sporulation